MTPELQQSIELLQYSISDLLSFLEDLELTNPLIKLHHSKSDYISQQHNHFDDKHYNLSSPTTTRHDLIELAKLHSNSKEQKILLKFIIEHLNHRGYLKIDTSPYPEDVLSEGILELQKIGPPGIGARTLQECLLLQIDYSKVTAPFINTLITEDLQHLANRNFNFIKNKYNCSSKEVLEILKYIRSLNPSPCNFSDEEGVSFIIPDTEVIITDSHLSFKLNDHLLPKISFSTTHSSTHFDQYNLKEFKQNYNWVIKSIHQRNSTLEKIMSVFIVEQREFFFTGYKELNPLTLEDVALLTDLHISTISRATSNKYIATPNSGTISMKSLFSNKINDSNEISQTKLKLLLQKVIHSENKVTPFSDQKLSDLLLDEYDIKIARRTVTKYREDLLIPKAIVRKQQYEFQF